MGGNGKPLEISVLIATRDRARILEATLLALRQQSLAGIGWEVIVIDNGSIDDTAAVLATFRRVLPLTVLHEPMPGKSRALNRALEVAHGDLLVFTDDDVEPCSSWLDDLYKASCRWTAYSIFCGPIIPNYPSGMRPWLQRPPYAKWAYGRFDHALPEGPFPDQHLPFGANFAVRASAMLEMRFSIQVGPNGNNYAMGCETELLQRLVKRGGSIIYVPSASVMHFIDESQAELWWLYKRAFRLGRSLPHLIFETEEEVPLLFGVPRYKVRQWLTALAQCALSLFRGEERLFYWGTKLSKLLGELYEYCVIASGSRQRVDSSSPDKLEKSVSP